MISDYRIRPLDLLALALIATASIIGINQYAYGLYNHFITVPFIKSIINIDLYPSDYLVAEKKYLYTYFNSFFALISKNTGLSLHVIYFVFYCVSLFLSLIAFFKLALTLFNRRETAYFTIILLIFSFTTLGEARTIDSLFLERFFVLPLLLFSFDLYLRKKITAAYALAGIAFLFHPLSALYALALLFTGSVLSVKETGWKKLCVSLALLAVIVSPVLYLKAINPAPSLNLFSPDKEWIELLRLRSSHHLFPFSWKPMEFVQAALFLAGFVISWKYQPEAWKHRAVKHFTLAVLLLCLCGTVFTELLPVSIVVQFQLFRGFVLLIYFAVIYYANFFLRESENRSGIILKIAVFLMFACIFYDLHSHRAQQMLKFSSFIAVALMIFPGYLIASGFSEKIRKFYFPVLLAALLIIGVQGMLARKGFQIQTRQEKQWLEVQRWAKANTPVDAAFIVAPTWEGFRVESERAIFGDWKDGTQMFFNPEFGKEWIRRMRLLGFDGNDKKLLENYVALGADDLKKIAEEMKPFHATTYVVMPASKTLPEWQATFSNERFSVYRVD